MGLLQKSTITSMNGEMPNVEVEKVILQLKTTE